ncbi:hypothetical protein [Micromonospora aurantiaca (nom. illeg.)]|uniref:hypothetical protein n=1 Tax=Micromonospora aurantiaca (nom. illeg.) TaxID=47850 RepID=UPI003F4A13F9
MNGATSTPWLGEVLEPGLIQAAVDAIRSGQRQFTHGQVALIAAMAYEMGRRHGYAEEIAELHGTWQEYALPRLTREDRVRQRMADMDRAARRRARRDGRPYRPHPGGPVDWNSGRPVP